MKIDWGKTLWRHHKWYIKYHRNENGAHSLSLLSKALPSLILHVSVSVSLSLAVNTTFIHYTHFAWAMNVTVVKYTVKSTTVRSIFGTFIIPSFPFALFVCLFPDTLPCMRYRFDSQKILFALDVFNFTIKTHFRQHKSIELNMFWYKYNANIYTYCTPVFSEPWTILINSIRYFFFSSNSILYQFSWKALLHLPKNYCSVLKCRSRRRRRKRKHAELFDWNITHFIR